MSSDSPAAETQRPVIITGMHRSGTSLLANLLQAAGVSVGDRLMEATEFNQHGYFEDLDFQELHEQILKHNGETLSYQELVGKPMAIEPRHWELARELVARRKGLALWGWKDPRTLLFLDMWSEVVPEAVFVFVYRDPVEVVDSLRRRRDVELMFNFPGAPWLEKFGFKRFRTARAVEMWCFHNRRLVEFAAKHPERCLVVDLARLAPSFPAIVERLRGDWGLAIKDVDVSDAYDPKLLGKDLPFDIRVQCEASPEVARLLAELQRLSVDPA